MKFSIDSAVNKGAKLLRVRGDSIHPEVYTSTREEMLAARRTAWLGSNLNITPVFDVVGPDAAKLLNMVCVNRDFNKLKISGSRHAIICNEKGQLMADGLITRLDEQTYRSYWLAPALSYHVEQSDLDVEGRWITDEYFFQLDGPKSLQIMEKAAGTDLHDIKFAGKKHIRIASTDVIIIRLGMTGCLAYEIHGDVKNADTVYNAVLDAGEEFGIKRLGFIAYNKSHTPGGYPNQWISFWYPWFSGSEDMTKYMTDFWRNFRGTPNILYGGSANDDDENYFVTPYDLGWDYLIDFNHEFIGKEALQGIAKNPPRKCVTLEWNADDVGAVFASQLKGAKAELVDDISLSADDNLASYIASKVLLNGEVVGIAAGRMTDYYTNHMISLAYIKSDLAFEGNEFKVLWGTNGAPQMEIRATVAPFPYYNEEYRNETFDVERIPRSVF